MDKLSTKKALIVFVSIFILLVICNNHKHRHYKPHRQSKNDSSLNQSFPSNANDIPYSDENGSSSSDKYGRSGNKSKGENEKEDIENENNEENDNTEADESGSESDGSDGGGDGGGGD